MHVLDYERGTVVASSSTREELDELAVQPGGQSVAMITRSGLLSRMAVTGEHTAGLRDCWPDDRSFGHEFAWSPDGAELLVTGFARTAWLFASAGWDAPASLTVGDETMVVCGAWSSDGARFALGGSNGLIQIFDRGLHVLQRLQIPWTAADRSAPCYLTALAFDPSTKRLAAGTSAAQTFLLRLSDGSVEQRLSHADLTIAGFLEITTIDFSPDGTRLVDTGNDWWQVREWEVATGKELWRFDNGGGNGHPLQARYSSDGARVLTNLHGRVFESRSGKPLARFLDVPTLGTGTLELLPDGRSGFVPTCAGIEVYDIESRRLLLRLSGGKVEPGAR
ncbi:MAG: WD40 repeat domain-containing protein [Planctomycetota bacterium]|nr:WD40 repeat domain-containing protein [Planctomycetota bacterium]